MKYDKVAAKDRMGLIKSDRNYRAYLFKELTSHLRNGYSIDCFGPISHETISQCVKDFPDEFCKDELQAALRGGKDGWETIGRDQATGKCMGNSRSWYYNMANRYGWRDKIDIEAQHSGQVQVEIVNYASKKHSTEHCEQE